MRYMMFVMGPPNPTPPPPALIEERNKWVAERTQAGEFIDGAQFVPAQNPTCGRLQDGKVKESDGPFAEAKEVVGGFILLDFPNHDAALRSAHTFMELHAKTWPGWHGSVTLLRFDAIGPHSCVGQTT